MVRKLIRASLFAALGSMAMILSFGAVTTAQDKKKTDKKTDELPDISEIMRKAHKGTDAYFAKIKTAVKGEKWEDAGKTAKDLSLAADALAKNTPGKGDKKSWETLTKKYSDGAKSVVEAIEKKDAKTVNDAFNPKTGSLGASCKGCHDKHK